MEALPPRGPGLRWNGLTVASWKPTHTTVYVVTTTSPATVEPALDLARSPQGTFSRLVRFAVANIRRRPERFALSTIGIALAIAAVVVVRTISASFAITGADTVESVLDGADLWVVPAAGVHYDNDVQTLVAEGPAPVLDLPSGWSGQRIVAGVWQYDGEPVAVHGDDRVAPGEAVMSEAVAERLGLGGGEVLPGTDLTVRVAGQALWVAMTSDRAEALVGDVGWWTVAAPDGDQGRNDLGQLLSDATGLPSSTDPSHAPDAAGNGLIYDTVASTGATTFEQRYSALFSGKVTGSTLGLISTIGLALGFVIAVSSFLAAVQERRREFGIMSSIGLADEVLYFFLVESGMVFLAAYLIGIAGAGVAVALVIPGIATPLAWLQAAGTVAAFLPAMAIVGALVPVHRLLQQRPVDLLGGA
jgi:putative ABC transport system permease protein